MNTPSNTPSSNLADADLPSSPSRKLLCVDSARRHNGASLLAKIRRKMLGCAQICQSPDSHSASKLISRRIELRGNMRGNIKVGGTMMERKLTVAETILIAGTRVALGAGIGLLLSTRLNNEQRKAAGLALALVGGLTTIPLALGVIGKRATTTEIRPAA